VSADIFEKAFTFRRDLDIQEAGLYPFFKEISSNDGNRVTIDGRAVVMAGSNNYLGLTRHPRVLEAANKAQSKYGTSCSGSRYANGTYTLHVELEAKLATWMQKESALCFTTGYASNLGAVSAIAGRHDLIFSDKENHACINDATALALGKTRRFAHQDMDDLEKQLADAPDDHGRLIVSDGVFSMKGTLANIPKFVEFKKKYGARIYIDDAHGLGVIGEKGRGTASHFGLHEHADLIMGTFSKSFAGLGGFICGEKRVVSFIKHHAKQLIFAAAMTPAATAAVLTTLDMIQNEPEHMANLQKVVKKVRKGFRDIGFDVPDGVTPIIYTRVGEDLEAFSFWKDLLAAGVYTNPVITPGVPQGWSGIRSSYMAIHTDSDIDHIVGAFQTLGKKYGLIA
jgi:8-amino-7-oxononanoate synthase